MDRDPTFYCDLCRDLGWQISWCGEPTGRYPEMPQAECGRHRKHAAHESATKCHCWMSNPALIQRRAGQDA
jgi:hypothetical protein